MVDGDLIIFDETEPPFTQELDPGVTYSFDIHIAWELPDGITGRIELFFADVSDEAITRTVTGTGESETAVLTADKTVPDDHGGQEFYISSLLYDDNDEYVEGDDETWAVSSGDNTPPSLDSLTPSEQAFEVTAGDSETFSVESSDPDGDALTHTWFSKLVEDDGYTQEATESGTLSDYTHTFSEIGDHLIKVEVDDGETYDSHTWTVGVGEEEQNNPPVIDSARPSGQPIQLGIDSTETFEVTVSDSNDDIENVEWILDGETQAMHDVDSTSPQTSEWVYTFRSTGRYTVEAIASDYEGQTDSATWTIEVAEDATPPIIERVNPDRSSIEVSVDTRRVFEARVTDSDDDLENIEWLLNGESRWVNNIGAESPQTSSWDNTFSTAGESTVEAAVSDSEGQTDSITWTVTVRETEIDIEVERIQVENQQTGSFSQGDDIRLSARLRNYSQIDADIEAELTIIGPTDEETDLPQTGRYQETVPSDRTAEVTGTWTVPRDPVGGSYGVGVWVYDARQDGSGPIANSTTEDVFTVDSGPSKTDLLVYPVDTQGSPITDTSITISAENGTLSASSTATGGEASFSGIPVGQYTVTAESQTVHQRIEEAIMASGEQTEHELVFEPAEAISGIVVKEEGDQVAPNASVRISSASLAPVGGQGTVDIGFNGRAVEPVGIEGLATRPDPSGQFTFDIPLPDGEYEFVVDSDAGANTETVDMGLNRSAALKAPITPPDPDNSGIQFQEENYLVSLALQNLELSDIIFPASMNIATLHGVLKGAVTAMLDIVDDLASLLEFDINEFIESIKRLWSLIIEDWTIIKQLLTMLIGDVLSKMREDNPYAQGTVEHQAFGGGWFSGYALLNIAIGFAVGAGAGYAGRVVASAPRVKRAVDSVSSLVENANRVPDSFALAARSTRKGTVRLPDVDSSATKKVAGVLESAPNPAFAKKVVIAYRTRLRGPSSGTIDNPLDSNDLGGIKGKIGETVALRDYQRIEALPSSGLFSIAQSLPDSLNDLVPGKRYVVQNVDLNSPTGTYTELDTVIIDVADDVGDSITADDLTVADVVEVTTSGNQNGWGKLKRKMTGIKQLQDDIDAGNINPAERSQGVPLELFRREKFDIGTTDPDSIRGTRDLPDSADRDIHSYGPSDRADTGFDETFDATSDEITETARYFRDNKGNLPLFDKALSGD